MKECQGQCKNLGTCQGEVKTVIVKNWVWPDGLRFNYCEEAVKIDQQNGFEIENTEQ